MPEGEKSDEIVVISGVQIALDPEVMSEQMLAVLRYGKYEREEAMQIPKIVEPGDRIVEIGGGVGFISSLAAKQEKAEAIVVYEANPDLIPLIRRNHQLNNVKAEVLNSVVQPEAEPSKVPFFIRKNFWASSLSAVPWGFRKQVTVPVTSFSDMLERHRPTMLIVDIEGGEIRHSGANAPTK